MNPSLLTDAYETPDDIYVEDEESICELAKIWKIVSSRDYKIQII